MKYFILATIEVPSDWDVEKVKAYLERSILSSEAEKRSAIIVNRETNVVDLSIRER